MDESIWRDCSCWRDRWEVIGEAGDGSQSQTYRARLADGSDPTPRFLKIPREQKKPERRKRLQREATALKIFSHHRIPRLVETNAHRHEEIGAFELYLVTEFVEGPTLGAFVAAGQRPSLDVSLDLAERLLDTVEHCHGHDCLHRDIKPPNIILREGNPADPMLVDFYLTVGWHDASAPSGGWRDQRDPRFDLTQLARILFFVLTGEFGVPCRDWAGVPPHRRPDRYAALMNLGGPRARRLLEFFDRGFDLAIEDRFQTAEECRVLLCEVRDTGRTDTGMRGPVPLGPRDAALVSAQDVIHLYRQNATGHAGGIPPDLALALNTLGGRMDALGQQEKPLAAARETVGPYHGVALNKLGRRLAGLGRHEEALATAQEAVAVYRIQAVRSPDGLSGLALALSALGNRLAALGQHEAALATAVEAVAIRRDQAGINSNAIQPDLVRVLRDLASHLAALGRREAAQAATQEAAGLYRAQG